MGGEVSEFLYGLGGIDVHRIDIECASVALAKEVDGLAVGAEHGVAVLAAALGKIGVLAGGSVVTPDVAGHRRGVVLAEHIFQTLVVLIEE